ncbi:MAG TPA: SDR family NAD(P)-dependent oxidoreductase [Actinospica sp.]|nr:SDR family NAD(P)-dependent oxidoreductase [Actinospica sp.]
MDTSRHEPIAVIGMSAILPDAADIAAYWANLTAGRYSIGDVPSGRWDPELFYDPDPTVPDKTYSRIGGWVRRFDWDPLGWHLPIPPAVGEQLDDGQKWAVAGARAALLDAGWPSWAVDAERVAVIVGNALGGDKHYDTNTRLSFPVFARALSTAPSFAAIDPGTRDAVLRETRRLFLAGFRPVTEDTMPGELANVLSGRVANLFNLRGPNFTTDAACASALAGVASAIRGLQAGDFDAAITGGVDRNMGVSAFVKFCKIGALSATGTRPFDAGADGFVMGEGAALFVLKRLADAERAGDRIYALITGIAGSSDGKGKGITAPNPVGQLLAVERAWLDAGSDPGTATYLEAHGTSTAVGDAVELKVLDEVFRKAGAAPGSIALGSVKSNIGHLKAAAGAAGLAKTVLSLHERRLAPSLHFERPNQGVDWPTTPLRVNTELREWPEPPDGLPRRAGVSAFGFGGTNYHAVLEEYVPGARRPPAAARSFASAAPTRSTVRTIQAAPGPGGIAMVAGRDDAEVLAGLRALRAPAPPDPAKSAAPVRVAIAYAGPEELAAKAAKAIAAFDAPAMWRALRAQGVFLGRGAPGKVAFLYPGQGSQYANMLAELRESEPIVADTFAEADAVMAPLLDAPLSSFVFGDDPAALEQRLLRTEITQPAVLTADLALTRLLASHGFTPDLVMGHSLGEYGALAAAGSLTFAAALEAVSARGHEMASLALEDNGAMAAVFGPLEEIERIVARSHGYVVIANINSTGQAVIGGATADVLQAVSAFEAAGMTATRIPVSHAFHTRIVAPATEPLKAVLRRLKLAPPRLPVVSNVTGLFYPEDAGAETMVDLLGRQVASPVRFVTGLRTLYDAGARVFVEVGPKKALQGFAEDVLGAQHEDVLALFTNHPKTGGLTSFANALAGLYAAGLGPRADAEPASEPEPEPVAIPAPRVATNGYAELGKVFAGAIEQGLRVLGSSADADTATGPAVPQAFDASAAEPVVITGAALGLPGVERVFDDANVARILAGEQFIGSVPRDLRGAMVDRRITRLVKSASADPTFETIEDEAEVIKLAGRTAPLDVVAEFGVDAERDEALDVSTRLAIGAGFDALRDAGIPLVMHYRTTTLGTRLPDRWGLPESMRDDTGVVFASAFPAYDSFAKDLEGYFTDRGRREQLAALLAVRDRVAESDPAGQEIDGQIARLRWELETRPYRFNRRFLFRALAMGHSQFAEIIGARGPNTQVNAACASTTMALAVAEDWIAAGRCRRVVVVSADDATSDTMLPWIGAGFLASGAAATDDSVQDAALPFDRRRHGMIVGAGAAALIVESAEAARERGLQPICEVLSTVVANSAFHGTRLDVDHISQVMERLLLQAEARGVQRSRLAGQTMFVSHETYTPARGGSAAAEINALRRAFGPLADEVVITNTKGFTGHAMGAGIEDVVAVKGLETGIVPPVPNFKDRDPELGDLNLSLGGSYPVNYALRLAAGFGSQIAMSLLRWTPMPDGRHRAPDKLGYRYRIADPEAWHSWLGSISGQGAASLEIVTRRLRVADPEATDRQADASPAPPAVTVPEPPAPEPASDEVAEAVVEIVARTTGYPPELLEPDLDLEADLGVDTVKQAEVFAAVRERFHLERDEGLRLRDFPTLNHVTGWVRQRLGTAAPQEVAVQAAEPESPDQEGVTVLRRVARSVVRPALDLCKPTGVTLGPGSRIVVMPDSGGVAKQLVGRLEQRGCEVVSLIPGAVPHVDGPVHGVFWLAGLDDEGPIEEMELPDWRSALNLRVKLLYRLMRALYEQSPFLVTGTRFGGRHGYGEPGATAVLGGAITGFAKAYRRERPESLVKLVDFQRGRKPAWIAQTLIEETLTDPGCVEIGHADSMRWTVGVAEEPRHGDGRPLGPESVVAVTGAAGGIVSAIVADLARHAPGTYHLLDLAECPAEDDADARLFDVDREALKLVLAERIKAAGRRPTPVLIEAELSRQERRNAARRAVEAVRSAGGTAHYHQVDLTDQVAVAAVLSTIRELSGRIDVLVHAAGMETSHALPDKEQAEFDRVFDVKADGWFNLLRGAGELPVGVIAAFSSVAARYGNAGQTDYSAANDLLCKCISGLRRTAPRTRALAVDWSAWAGIGMAARGSIPTVMKRAGIELLPPEDAIAWLRAELTETGESGEVVAAGGLGELAAPPDDTGGVLPERFETAQAGPMIGSVESFGADGLTVRTTLDPRRQPFLDDHRIDGTPVLPGVMGIEAFAEAARLAAPDWLIEDVEDVEFSAPLKFYRDEPREIVVRAVLSPEGKGLIARCALEAERTMPRADGRGTMTVRTVHFTGTVRLGRRPGRAERQSPPRPAAHAVPAADVYRLFFHGPAYQVVASAWKQGHATAAALADGLPPDHEPRRAPLLAAPRLVELCFQTAGLVGAAQDGALALPRHVDRVRVWPGAEQAAFAKVQRRGEQYDAVVLDAEGGVIVRLEGYRATPLPGPVPAEIRGALIGVV